MGASLECACWDDPDKAQSPTPDRHRNANGRSSRKVRVITDSDITANMNGPPPPQQQKEIAMMSIDQSISETIGTPSPVSVQQSVDSELASPRILSPISLPSPTGHHAQSSATDSTTPRTPSKRYKIVVSPSPIRSPQSSFSAIAATVPDVPDVGDDEWDESDD